MSSKSTRDPRNRLFLAVVMAVLLVATAVGFLAEAPGAPVPEAMAAGCQGTNGYCPPGVRTAFMLVQHAVRQGTPGPGATYVPVEPDTGESWNITAYWNTQFAPCTEYSETASVDVDWNGSSWALSNESTTTNITDIELCSTSGYDCSEGESIHAWGYKLKAEVNDPVLVNRNLRKVTFTTTAVDDGDTVDDSTCELDTAVSAVSQTNSADDDGSFECGVSCSNDGGSMYILYE